ncbi:MAG: IclR family transcriptional regulator [Firmicutes bacterium]|nr:IclR family transcriptional regulator [Bacillota bacterium]
MEILQTENSTDYTIQVVEKAVAVLTCFLEPPHSFGISEVARRVSLNKNQTFRLLTTLEQTGLLVRTAGRPEYRLSWRVMELGQVAGSGVNLRQAAQPIMSRLAMVTQETIHLVAFDGVEAVCVDRRESPQVIKLSAAEGQRWPLHAGACPKVILAALPPGQARACVERNGFIPYTDKTARNWGELSRELAEIRQQGYALSREDVNDGAEGVGAVIIDGAGRVAGAISVAGPAFRFSAKIPEFAALVRVAAADIAAQLGRRDG